MFEMILDFFEEYIDNTIYAFQYHSSEIRWCEYQFIQSNYIVEFWNTITSLFITLVGLYGLTKSSKRAQIFYSLLIFIGLASAYFHATLSFTGQLLDELGITTIMLIANHTVYSDDKTGLTLVHIFGLIQIMFQFVCPEYNRFVLFLYAVLFVNKFWSALFSRDKKTRWYAHITVAMFLMGVVCWICDFYICNKQSPFNFHGIWHIFIAFASYFTIETCILVTKKKSPKQSYWSDYYET